MKSDRKVIKMKNKREYHENEEEEVEEKPL